MGADSVFVAVFVAICALAIFFVVALVLKIIRKGGFKAALFGAPIQNTVGEIKGANHFWTRTSVKVHRLNSISPDTAVGLEIVGRTFGSFQLIPVSLSAQQAKELAILLTSAADTAQFAEGV